MTTNRIKTNDDIFDVILEKAVIEFTYREAERVPPKEELDKTYTMSERHKKRMEKLCLSAKRKDRFKMKTIPRIRRTAVAALIAFTALSGTMMAYPTVRAAVSDVFVEWFDQFTQFTGRGTTSAEQKWELSFIPEGYVEIERTGDDSQETIRYENESGLLMIFKYQPMSGSLGVDNEGMEHSTILSDGVTYDVFQSIVQEKQSAVVWCVDGYMFRINGFIDAEALLEAAFSVSKK